MVLQPPHHSLSLSAQISDQQTEEKDGTIARIQMLGVERMREVPNENG
jgi:hypothetical protein